MGMIAIERFVTLTLQSPFREKLSYGRNIENGIKIKHAILEIQPKPVEMYSMSDLRILKSKGTNV